MQLSLMNYTGNHSLPQARQYTVHRYDTHVTHLGLCTHVQHSTALVHIQYKKVSSHNKVN